MANAEVARNRFTRPMRDNWFKKQESDRKDNYAPGAEKISAGASRTDYG